MKFTATREFYSDKFRSIYTPGVSYNVTPNNHALRAAVEGWHKQNWVKYIDEPVPGGLTAATISGKGTVRTVSPVKLSTPTLIERIKSWL